MEFASDFSSYSTLTVERILERFNIRLSHAELRAMTKNHANIYYQLMCVPLQNIFNGVIAAQVHDYQVYAQKLFIDYLLAGEDAQAQDAPGAHTRTDLSEKRSELMLLGEDFTSSQRAQRDLIATSQAYLIKSAQDFKSQFLRVCEEFKQRWNSLKVSDLSLRSAINLILIEGLNDTKLWLKCAEILKIELSKNIRKDLSASISQLMPIQQEISLATTKYLERASMLTVEFKNYRSQFYALIISVSELMQSLPTYAIDKELDAANRAKLYFDPHLGNDPI